MIRGGWREYDRLRAAGVSDRAAGILAGVETFCGTERAYWRHLANGITPDGPCRAAHAYAQRRRRGAS